VIGLLFTESHIATIYNQSRETEFPAQIIVCATSYCQSLFFSQVRALKNKFFKAEPLVEDPID
jgi:hypothetical protein